MIQNEINIQINNEFLPPNWKIVRLKDISEIIRGVTYNKNDINNQLIPGYCSILRATNISDGFLDLKTDLVFVRIKNVSNKQLLKIGDIVVAMSSGSKKVVGKSAQLFVEWQGSFGAFCAIIRPNNLLVDPFFVGYFMRTDAYRDYIEKVATGTNIKNLTKQHILNLTIPLPPLPEQRAIAHVLRTVQEAREKTEAVIEAAKTLKKSMMQYLFTYGPVPIDEAEQVPLKETEIGMVPEGWEIVKLEEIALISMGQSPNGDTYNDKNIGMPLLNGPTEFGRYYPLPKTWTSAPTKKCEKDDILFCVRGNTTGRMNIADRTYCIGRGLAAIRAKPTKSINNYIFAYLIREEKNLLDIATAGGSTFPNITKFGLFNYKIPSPPLLIQEQISNIFTSIDKKIAAEESRKAALDQLFQTLLHELMTAKIRVNHISVPVAET